MGRYRSLLRAETFRDRRQLVYEDFGDAVESLADLIHRRRWKQFCRRYAVVLPRLLRRVCCATEPWIKVRWARLTRQWGTSRVEVMADRMRIVLTQQDSSCIYHMINTRCAWSYVGLVEQRPALERLVEHLVDMIGEADRVHTTMKQHAAVTITRRRVT